MSFLIRVFGVFMCLVSVASVNCLSSNVDKNVEKEQVGWATVGAKVLSVLGLSMDGDDKSGDVSATYYKKADGDIPRRLKVGEYNISFNDESIEDFDSIDLLMNVHNENRFSHLISIPSEWMKSADPDKFLIVGINKGEELPSTKRDIMEIITREEEHIKAGEKIGKSQQVFKMKIFKEEPNPAVLEYVKSYRVNPDIERKSLIILQGGERISVQDLNR